MIKEVKFREIKPEIRVLGVDDCPFKPLSHGSVDVVGVVYRGGYWLDGIMTTEVQIDGLDATEKIAKMIVDSPHYDQLRVIMLNGITFAGFNVVSIRKLFNKTRLPVIVLTKEKPDLEEIRVALRKLPQWRSRWKAMIEAGEIFTLKTRRNAEPLSMQIMGISRQDAEKIVKMTCTRSSIPEAVRVAHIIASGIA
jgi:hypothetical protein